LQLLGGFGQKAAPIGGASCCRYSTPAHIQPETHGRIRDIRDDVFSTSHHFPLVNHGRELNLAGRHLPLLQGYTPLLCSLEQIKGKPKGKGSASERGFVPPELARLISFRNGTIFGLNSINTQIVLVFYPDSTGKEPSQT